MVGCRFIYQCDPLDILLMKTCIYCDCEHSKTQCPSCGSFSELVLQMDWAPPLIAARPHGMARVRLRMPIKESKWPLGCLIDRIFPIEIK